MRLALDPPLDPAAYAYHHRIRARFAETDAMGVVHHAAYLPWLEEARVAWLRDVGHSYVELRAEGIDFAVLEVFTQYRAPVRFDDEVDLHIGLGHLTRATMQVGYLLMIDDRPVATAVTVHGTITGDGRPARMPAWVATMAGTTLDDAAGSSRPPDGR
jgi:acyl-CoA thioester hydrolase